MSKWSEVPLAEIVEPVFRSVAVIPGKQYRTIGVKWWGEGAYERETIDGSRTSAKMLNLVREGDLIINKIWVRHGSTAMATASVDGCAASGEFPTFQLKLDRALPRWVHWQIKTRSFWSKCAALSRGSSGKNRIKPELFLTIKIPLPPLAEQRRIVSRIEELAAKIQEAHALRQQAIEEAEALISRATSARMDECRWSISPLGEILAEKPRNGLGPQPEASLNGRTMLRINSVSSTQTRFVDTTAGKQVQVSEKVARPFLLRDNDVFVVRYNGDINRVAKPAIYKGRNEDGIVFPDKLIRLRPDHTKMTSDFLVFALNSRTVRGQIEALGKTTAGNIGVSGSDVQSFVIPVPPLREQHRIVAELGAMQTEVDRLKRLQAESAAELDALLPAILDRAFKGELLPEPPVEIVAPRPRAVPPCGSFDRSYVRTVFAAEFVDRMHGDRHFGQVKLQKLLYLGEYHARVVEIESRPVRYERGPHDPEMIREIEAQLKASNWFEEYPRSPDHPGHAYRPLDRAGEHRAIFEQLWPEQASTLRWLIDTMQTWETERCERVATLYAAWNDLLLWNQPATDDAILREVLECWHTAKQKIARAKWQESLDWMRREGLIPTGFGRATAPAPQPELFT